MSYYRSPLPPKSNLITPEGYKNLQDELDYLWRVKRPEVTRSVSEAAAQGDVPKMPNIFMVKNYCVKLIDESGFCKNAFLS